MKSLTVIALFAVLGVCDAAAFPESMQQEDSNVIDSTSIFKRDLMVSKDLPSNPAVSRPVKWFQPKYDGSDHVKIDYRIISGQAADDLANSLLVHYAKLSEAVSCIKSNENIISAIKLRSLVPDYVIDVDAIKKSSIDSSNEILSYEIDPSRQRLINAINVDIQPLILAKDDAALKQIVNFDFNGDKSFREFVAEKEAQIVEKKALAFGILSKFQQILQLNSQKTSKHFSTALLNFVAATMDCVSVFYKKLQGHQIKFETSTLPEKAKALKKVYEYRYYLNGQLQEIILCLQRS